MQICHTETLASCDVRSPIWDLLMYWGVQICSYFAKISSWCKCCGFCDSDKLQGQVSLHILIVRPYRCRSDYQFIHLQRWTGKKNFHDNSSSSALEAVDHKEDCVMLEACIEYKDSLVPVVAASSSSSTATELALLALCTDFLFCAGMGLFAKCRKPR